MDEESAFSEVKKSLDEALEEIKRKNPALYEHLKKSIVMDEESKTFCYRNHLE